MNIALIGGTIESLLVAEHFSRDHKVYVIEIDAEIGLPAVHPGRATDIDTLGSYFSESQLNFLALHENPDGWGCRWDWILKHLAANAARAGVEFLTRTRILSSTLSENKILLQLSSSERDKPIQLAVERLISFSASSSIGTGGKTHSTQPHEPELFHALPSVTWFGGTVLSKDASDSTGAELQIKRGDGMTELWWKKKPTWNPPHGFIEQCSSELSPDSSDLSFDSVVSRVRAFLHQSV